ncbi:protein phosphatase CheZ [Methylobrevis albus]|uniref:Protein phosphatase CheZ n=1 Tax=Methylobrevis albus TaxID=2793297 RepID=A0A931I0Z5_9HYPH|nr:protein phosphatase CheZ [Methylobrevis albus]MBH0238185.1 protein phosphatase CheZ [Methylobrevis albus]
MTLLTEKEVSNVVDYLKRTRLSEDVSLDDVMGLAEVMAESLRPALSGLDATVHRDLGDMAREIAAMKRELAEMRLGEVRTDKIGTAGRELDAVVEATEEATNIIMTAAEAIMGADPADVDGFQAVVNDRVIEIFEACSFQDITGQRIGKVVSTLSLIDDRLNRLVERLKLNVDAPTEPAEETAAERRARELILHGPQAKGEGVSQNDIDDMFP